MFLFCFKQKTAYEMRISDWSSDVCSSDLRRLDADLRQGLLDVFPEPLPLLAVWRHVVHDLEAGTIPLAREAGFIQQLVRDLGAVRGVVVLDVVGVEAARGKVRADRPRCGLAEAEPDVVDDELEIGRAHV